ncbi:MAG: Glutathione import ATP-binding protein GsiA [Pseudomonadota bacterium]|jgi:peptide/nickel transport system ATP-binding protein
MSQQLNVQNLVVDLQTEQGMARAVDALHLTLKKGQTFALVGESGCGKSMTALSLLRLLPDNAVIQNGKVNLNDVDVFDLSEKQMRSIRGRRISIIFQEPSTSLNPVMTVGDQILEVIFQHTDLQAEEARKRAIEWLHKVGLPEPERRMGSYPFELSGGQLQRVMIAIALAAEPDLLIADEPTTALDVTIQAQILDLLKSLQQERGMAMLLITHDLAVVSGMADQVALMYAGQIVEVASAADFFVRPSHPYAKLLLQALPGEDLRGRQLAAIHGTVPPLTQTFKGCRFAPRCPYQTETCTDKAVAMTALSDTHNVRCVRVHDASLQSLSLPPLLERAQETSLDHSVLLSVKNLSVTYSMGGGVLGGKKTFQAVKGVSFDIQKGQTLALVGESGCGKTTIGKSLLQLLTPQTEVTGQAILQGQDLFQLKGQALQASRKQMQIIFQNPFASLNPRMRVQEILEEGMKSLHPEWSMDQRKADLKILMDQVGLRADALDRYPHEFSGGQRQRIAIARALAVKPSLIVCDEPTSALDVSVQAQILNLLRELQDHLGVSYLFVTHNIGVVAYLADRVAVMHAGEMVEMGDASQILNNPQHAYTKSLLSAVPQLNTALS